MTGSRSRSWWLPDGGSSRGEEGCAQRNGAGRSHRRAGMFVVVAAVLAASAVPGLSRSVALASASPVLNWTQQHPATHPPARYSAAMTYDAATGNVVLFGGKSQGELGDTWVWNSSTWTQQHPATSPS